MPGATGARGSKALGRGVSGRGAMVLAGMEEAATATVTGRRDRGGVMAAGATEVVTAAATAAVTTLATVTATVEAMVEVVAREGVATAREGVATAREAGATEEVVTAASRDRQRLWELRGPGMMRRRGSRCLHLMISEMFVMTTRSLIEVTRRWM